MDKNSANNRFRENSLNENLNDRGHNSTEDTVDSVQNLSTNSKHKWLKTTNVIVMECYYLSKPVDEEGKPIRGYRRRMHGIWKERGLFNVTEQRLCDQTRMIRKNEWLTTMELEEIKRRVLENNDEIEEEEEKEERESEENWGTGDQMEDDERTALGEPVNLDNELQTDNIAEATEEEREIVTTLLTMMKQPEEDVNICFKKADKKRLSEETKRVNGVLKYIKTRNISETNRLMKVISVYIADKLGIKRENSTRKNEIPRWKRRLENDIKQLRYAISMFERKKNGLIRKQAKVKALEKKYKTGNKDIEVIIEELKQRVKAKKAKISRYDKRILQFRQNRLFATDQKKFYNEINGEYRKDKIVPDAKESKEFWEGIWSEPKKRKEDAEWLKEIKDVSRPQQEEMHITTEKVHNQCRKIPNWKAPGPDGIHGFWLKKLPAYHQTIAEQLEKIVNGEEESPGWMTSGRTVLCIKDSKKGNAADNFRPISCLPVMWKLMTGIIAEHIYEHLEENGLLPEEQKGCRKQSRGTKDQLLIDKVILKDCKKRHTNLAMAWVDYRKAYDLVPHSWIIECLEMFGIARNVKELINSSMSKWNTELTACGKQLGNVSIRRGIFQGDSLSPLLFVICMIPLSLILRKTAAGYSFKGNQLKINHLLYMDDLKLYGKSNDQIDSLVRTVYLFTSDVGMEFGVKKCGIIVLKRGKMVECNGIELANGEVIKRITEEGYTYLGVMELDQVMEEEMKKKITKEFYRRLKLILKSKLNGRNIILAINTWAVAVIRYGAGIIDWNMGELKQVDRKTRKIITMNGALHPKSDIDRLYLGRKNGGRGLISCEYCVRAEENNLRYYLEHTNEPLLNKVRDISGANVEETMEKREFKSRAMKVNYNKWEQKKMYGQYVREIKGKSDLEQSWTWIWKSDLKVETEALIFAAQEQALRTNYLKFHIDKTGESPLCRMCNEKGESVNHVISECKKLAQTDYKQRHDNLARIVHWKLCGENQIERANNWYEHEPKGVVETKDIKLLWDFMIQCDHHIVHRKPDIVIIEKSKRVGKIIDIAIPVDNRIEEKENKKIEKYENLRREMKQIWNLKSVHVIPVVIGALGAITGRFHSWIKSIGIEVRVKHLQKTALLGTSKILRKVLEK